jgi:hypothetical protein
MPISQNRLLQIVNAADHVAKKHEQVHKKLRLMCNMNDPKEFLNQKFGLSEFVAETMIDQEYLSVLLREIAHFRVHFKKNDRRRVSLALQRANKYNANEDDILDDYFNNKEFATPESFENQSHEICPSCGVQATFFEKEKHLDSCEYKNEAPGTENDPVL